MDRATDCWFGRRCPYRIVDEDEEIGEAYRFARFAIHPEELTDPHTKAKRIEWQFTRESMQWTCWLHALDTKEDRLAALELISLVGKFSQVGQEWEVLRTAARRRVAAGIGTKEDEDLLALDEPE